MPTERDRRHLESSNLSRRHNIRFFGNDIENPGVFDAIRFYQEALREIRRAKAEKKPYAGLLADDDYPANVIGSLLAERLSFPGPSARSLFLCQHKYYSRLAQRASVPEATLAFFPIPLDRLPKRSEIPMPFPFFVKPVKGYLSILSRKIHSYGEFKKIWTEARGRLPPFVVPFDALLKESGLKREFPLGGAALIGEEILEGRQVTLEGYVYRGRVREIDIVDSVFHPGTGSFKRFECPSRVPGKIREKMLEATERFLRHIRFDNSLFNIEFIYNSSEARIVEVNSRMASQFADMMEGLHGTNTYKILLDLSAGKAPRFRRNRGKDKVAASFVLRKFSDAWVASIPSPKELEKIRKKIPGTGIEIFVESGRSLSSHFQQDDESYRYALINVCARNRRALFRKYQTCRRMLRFRFSSKSGEKQRGNGR